jgi:uncharacterized protein
LRHLHGIACQLRDAPHAWEPVFSIAEVEARELVDAEDWCIGFLQAVALDADAWTPYFERDRPGAALRPIVLLGADEAELAAEDVARLAEPHARDETSPRGDRCRAGAAPARRRAGRR